MIYIIVFYLLEKVIKKQVWSRLGSLPSEKSTHNTWNFNLVAEQGYPYH